MRILVCLKQASSGELNPFDACAYEAALNIENAEVILLSMAAESTKEFFLNLTRLGAEKAILLADKAFAGADTYATSYVLAKAIEKINPDYVFCGKQTMDGDTAQVGPETAQLCNYSLAPYVMSVEEKDGALKCDFRFEERRIIKNKSLLMIERINTLRLPSIRSKKTEIEIWNAEKIGADIKYCGLKGSPTRVLKTCENDKDYRHCKFINPEDLKDIIKAELEKDRLPEKAVADKEGSLKNIWIVGKSPRKTAETVSDDITEIELTDAVTIAEQIKSEKPFAVLWGSDSKSKIIAPQVAAILKTGLCADCTKLETDGKDLFMYRPAFSGNIIAKIKCKTRPVMATVRTEEENPNHIAIGIGYGAKDEIKNILELSKKLKAQTVCSRKIVDNGFYPYEYQVGLTGKTISPDVYIAIGISGAIHHIAGIRSAKIVIAVNCDKDAPIFKYSDYGIVCNFNELSKIKIT